MSGKLIYGLKRKREESQAEGQCAGGSCAEIGKNGEVGSSSKREKLTDSENRVDSTSDGGRTSGTSGFLLEALKKIIELQSELGEFSGESENSGDEDSDEDPYISETEAQALGFAMCARETLLFLQNEGVPIDSPMYQALRERLVGRSSGIPI